MFQLVVLKIQRERDLTTNLYIVEAYFSLPVESHFTGNKPFNGSENYDNWLGFYYLFLSYSLLDEFRKLYLKTDGNIFELIFIPTIGLILDNW